MIYGIQRKSSIENSIVCPQVCEKLKVTMEPIVGTELTSFRVPEESSNSFFIHEQNFLFNF